MKLDQVVLFALVGFVTFWIAELYIPAVSAPHNAVQDLPHAQRHPVVSSIPRRAAKGPHGGAEFGVPVRGPGLTASGLPKLRVVDVARESHQMDEMDEDMEDHMQDGGGGAPLFISSSPAVSPARGIKGDDAREKDIALLRKALRKAQTNPSPALQQALAEYETRHRAAISDPSGKGALARYLVYVSGGNDGYGNRLPGLAAAFVWAVISERVLLVYWQDTYKEPASFGELFDPGFEMDCLKVQAKPVVAALDRNKKLQPSKGKVVLVYRDAFKELATKDLNRHYPEQVVLFKSDDWPLPLLANNPFHSRDIEKIFGRSNVFGHVARFLLKPAPALLRKSDEVYRSKFSEYAVGLHLRLTKPMPSGGSKGKKVPEPEVFFKVAHMVAVSNGYPLDKTVFYIASDQPIARQKAADFFEARRLKAVWMDSIQFSFDGDRDSKSGLLNAIVEMHLLSRCDEVVGSYGSSFSAVASSWGGVIRYDVRADGNYWYSGMAEPCWRFASRGHGSVVKGGVDMAYHMGCHEGLSTFKGWQQDKDFALRKPASLL